MPLLPTHGNQSIDLHHKSIGWFLYEGNAGIQWVNKNIGTQWSAEVTWEAATRGVLQQ